MDINKIEWLEKWSSQKCFEDWEEDSIVQIAWIGNPGWHVTIIIRETKLETKKFKTIDIENDENDWIICKVSQGVFEGAGNLDKLDEILNIFISWAETEEVDLLVESV